MGMHPNQTLQVIIHQCSFLVTGLCTTLGVQWIFYRGAASSISLLPQLSNYTGMLLVGCFIPHLIKRKREMAMQYKMIEQNNDMQDLFIDTTSHLLIENEDKDEEELKLPVPSFMKEEGPIPHFSIMKLASLEIAASFALTIGFSIIGSGMYQVIYSSVVIWCAILTWVFMGKSVSGCQWLAIVGTSVGLGLSSLDSIRGSMLEVDHVPLDDQLVDTKSSLLDGTLLTLGGTFISACIYVYADTILSKNDRQPLPARVCCWMGFYTSCFTWLWILLYTIPHFDEMIHVDESTSTFQVVMFYIVVTLANALHAWNYYELIERTGNVATGILQGLRAILVYSLSHFWFCQEDSAQCFTSSKGCGSIIVITCVLIFTLGKK